MQLKLENNAFVLIAGGSSVGKRSLLERFTKNKFAESPKAEAKSSDAAFKKVSKPIDDRTVHISGSMSAVAINDKTGLVSKRVDVAVLTYDLANPESLNGLQEKYDVIKKNVPNCQFVLLGNKADLNLIPDSTFLDAVNAFKTKNDITVHSVVSAKEGTGTEEFLASVVKLVPKKIATSKTVPVSNNEQKEPPVKQGRVDKSKFEALFNPNHSRNEETPSSEEPVIQQSDEATSQSSEVAPPPPPSAPPAPPAAPTPTPTPLPVKSGASSEQKAVPTPPRAKGSCTNLFWQVMKSPVVTAIGAILLLAGVAAILAATYGIGGAVILGGIMNTAGIITLAGGGSALVGAVSLSASMYSMFGRGKGDVTPPPPPPAAPETTPPLVLGAS